MLTNTVQPYEALLPDVLPVGICFTVQVRDAGKVYDRELGIDWTKDMEYLQFHLSDGSKHIWIMRIATFRDDVRYCVAFGESPDLCLPESISFDELREAVRNYLGGG